MFHELPCPCLYEPANAGAEASATPPMSASARAELRTILIIKDLSYWLAFVIGITGERTIGSSFSKFYLGTSVVKTAIMPQLDQEFSSRVIVTGLALESQSSSHAPLHADGQSLIVAAFR